MYASLIWLTGHAGLPPTYLQICRMDISRDDGLILEQVLRGEAHVPTKMGVYPGMPHIFWSTFTSLRQTKIWANDTVKGVGRLFGRNSRVETASTSEAVPRANV